MTFLRLELSAAATFPTDHFPELDSGKIPLRKEVLPELM